VAWLRFFIRKTDRIFDSFQLPGTALTFVLFFPPPNCFRFSKITVVKKIVLQCFLLIWLSTEAQTDKLEIKYVELPSSTVFGTSDGKLVSKEITASGGTIISADGKVQLIFPDGALTTTATISIQPTSNLVPNGNGKAYQLEPSGMRFAKPVTLIFHYTEKEAAACPPELMFLAIQDSKGTWEYMDYEDWDSTTRSLKGFITHFSSVVNGNLAELYPREETLKVNGKTNFTLNIVTAPDRGRTLPANADEDELPPLPSLAPLGNYQAIWSVNEKVGGSATFGTVAPERNKSQAVYTAPKLLPLDYVVILKLNAALYINEEKVTPAAKRKGKMITYGKQLADKATFTSNINLYDEYDVKITALVDNTRSGPFTQKWTDESSFILRVGKEPGISNISNSLYKLEKENFTNNNCQFAYLNNTTCKGPVHVVGIKGAGLSGGSASAYVTALVDFVPVPWELPKLQITCRNGSIPTMPFPSMPAFPQKMKFSLKAGTFNEEYSEAGDFLPGGKITITLKQKTEE
jgi:hypothetical protein